MVTTILSYNENRFSKDILYYYLCSGLGKGAILAQVVILRKGGSKFNDIHINMLIKQ